MRGVVTPQLHPARMTMETETITEVKADFNPQTTIETTKETETHDLHNSTGRLTPEITAETNQSQPQKAKKAPWVRYRAEYRHRVTDELVHQKDTETR